MKKILYLYLMLGIMMVNNSCQKNDMPLYLPGDMIHGSLHACRNGDDWVASGQAGRYPANKNLLGIVGYTYSEEGMPRESFHISGIPLKKNVFEINGNMESLYNLDAPFAFFTTSADDGDVAEDIYYLRKHPKSCVEITHLDTLTNKVEGEFEVYLEVETPKRGEQNADKLCFKRGRFSVDIIE